MRNRRHTIRTAAPLGGLLAILLFSPDLPAQRITALSGSVVHAETGQPVSGVNVYVRNTRFGGVSDDDGVFRIRIAEPGPEAVLIFSHISFHPREVTWAEAQKEGTILLKPRVLRLPAISVTAEKISPLFDKDVPQIVTIIDAGTYEGRGYDDVGDALRGEHGVQVEEMPGGRKTVAVRGGNPDDVIILYDGIKLNSIANNVFNLSQINLESVQQIEILRGSSTALYGAGALSGVINIVPRTSPDYSIKYQHRIGSLTGSDMNAQLHRDLYKGCRFSYTFRRGMAEQKFMEESGLQHLTLNNKRTYHTASIQFDLPEQDDKDYTQSLQLIYFRSDLGFANDRYRENMEDMNQILTFRYKLETETRGYLSITGSCHWLGNKQERSVESDPYSLQFRNRAWHVKIERRLKNSVADLLLSYQLESGRFDFANDYFWTYDYMQSISSAAMNRLKHGLVSILKVRMPSLAGFIRDTEFNLSYRYEFVKNRYDHFDIALSQPDLRLRPILHADDSWHLSMLNFSGYVSGSSESVKMSAYMNFGTNFKYPSLVQEIGNPLITEGAYTPYQPNLNPEWSRGLDLGCSVEWEGQNTSFIDELRAGLNVFVTSYTNKIRVFTSLFSPVTIYDNVASANISGFESNGSLSLFGDILTFKYSTAHYSISDKAAFPYKSEHKQVLSLAAEHSNFSVLLSCYWESEKLAWSRDKHDSFYEHILPSYTNLDIHVSKTFTFRKLECHINLSGLHLIDDSTIIDNFIIRDPRFFITLGVQY